MVFKSAFRKWVEKVGPLEVRARLARRGVGMSTIEKMVAGTYSHEPRGLNRITILEEMAKDGFTLSGEVA